MNKNLCEFLDKRSILLRTSNADEPCQNDLIERMGQSIYNAAITMLKHSKKTITPSMWPYAVIKAETVHKILPSALLDGSIPQFNGFWYKAKFIITRNVWM